MSDQLTRNIRILQFLPREPSGITVVEIINRLESDYKITASTRMIQRDMVTLSTLVPIIVGVHGWCWEKNAPLVSFPGLTVIQAVTLSLIEKYLSPLLPLSMLKELQPFFDQANNTIKKAEHTPLAKWREKIAVVHLLPPLKAPSIDPKVNETVSGCLLTDKQVEILYEHLDGEEKVYDLNPLGLVLRGGISYLIANPLGSDGEQMFAMHRIKKAIEKNQRVQIAHLFDLQEYVNSQHAEFGKLDNNAYRYTSSRDRRLLFRQRTIPVELVFSERAARYVLETPLSDKQSSTRYGNGHVLIIATVQDTEQLLWWLRSYGSDVEVLNPPELREKMRDSITALAHKYNTGQPWQRSIIQDGIILLPKFAVTAISTLLPEVNTIINNGLFPHLFTPGGYPIPMKMVDGGSTGWELNDNHTYIDPNMVLSWSGLPLIFLGLAQDAAAQAGFTHFSPDTCLIICSKPGTNALPLLENSDHQAEGTPTVTVSLGLPANFWYSGKRPNDKISTCGLEHGDVLIWEGGIRLNFQRVTSGGSCPHLGRRHINLTFKNSGLALGNV